MLLSGDFGGGRSTCSARSWRWPRVASGRSTSCSARGSAGAPRASAALAVAMAISAVLLAPVGDRAGGGEMLTRPSVLAVGLAVGVLSSAIPYALRDRGAAAAAERGLRGDDEPRAGGRGAGRLRRPRPGPGGGPKSSRSRSSSRPAPARCARPRRRRRGTVSGVQLTSRTWRCQRESEGPKRRAGDSCAAASRASASATRPWSAPTSSGVLGWVRNEDDGTVLVHAEGAGRGGRRAGRVARRGAARGRGRRGRRSSRARSKATSSSRSAASAPASSSSRSTKRPPTTGTCASRSTA